MKGLLIGLFYFIFGSFGAIGTLLYKFSHFLTDYWYYFLLFFVSFVGLIWHAVTAHFYKNRERPTSDGSEDETRRRRLYEEVFGR